MVLKLIKKYVILIASIFVVAMFLMPVSSVAVYDEDNTPNKPSNDIWFARGTFKFLDEDEDYIYLKIIHARIRGFGNGISAYNLGNIQIKILKPFHGSLPTGILPRFGIGIFSEWDYNFSDCL